MQRDLRIPISAGYDKCAGYILAHLLLHQDHSFDLHSGGYDEDDAYWLYIREYNNLTDEKLNAHEKTIQLLIKTLSDVFQDGILQIPSAGM